MLSLSNYSLEATARDRVWMAILRNQGTTFTAGDLVEQMRRDHFSSEPPVQEFVESVLRIAVNHGVVERIPGTDVYRLSGPMGRFN